MLLALISLNQGLALGALGLLICALSDAGPAIRAVCSRFERIRHSCDHENESDMDCSSSIAASDLAVDHDLLVNSTSSKGNSKIVNVPSSIRSMRRVADFGLIESPVHDGDRISDDEFSSLSSWASRTNSLCSNFNSKGSLGRNVAEYGRFGNFQARLKQKTPWRKGENPLVTFLTVVAGLFHLAFMMLSTSCNGRSAKRSILPQSRLNP